MDEDVTAPNTQYPSENVATIGVEPLTAIRHRDGRVYERLPRITEQIRVASQLIPTDLLDHARAGLLAPETIVYFLLTIDTQLDIEVLSS